MIDSKVFFACPIGERGEYFVEVEERIAKQLQADMAGAATNKPVTLIVGREPHRGFRPLRVNPSQVVAIEPIED